MIWLLAGYSVTITVNLLIAMVRNIRLQRELEVLEDIVHAAEMR
jgi:hypothetical protein